MGATAEAWFAAWGCLAAAVLLFGLGCLAWARVTGKLPGARPVPVQPAPEYPQLREHDAGECRCGETHEDAEPLGQCWRES